MYENYIEQNNNKENDSGIENDNSLLVRVCISELNMQKIFKFNLDETIWNCKQKILNNIAKELRDGMNYGFYLPPYQGRAGKFLDDCRLLKEYSLNGPVASLEFKYKKRVYKFVKLNQKDIKSINQKAYLRRFLDYIRANNVRKVNKLLAKGLDPNFHSDLGETPLTIAVSLANPADMIMTLYNGGAHLDFRSRDSLTPMHKAGFVGNEKSINTLIELRGFVNVHDAKNLTPLFYVISNANSVECMELLLYNGSQVDCFDDQNWREMHYACKLGLSHHLDHLIYYGADINAQNNSGNTPLHVSAIHNCENCTRILLFRGANKTIRNLSNQTAYDVACIAGNMPIADLIKNHRDSDVVPIREKPQVAKRRTLYSEPSQSSHYSSMANVSYSTLTHMSSSNSLSKSSKSTLNLWTSQQQQQHQQQQSLNQGILTQNTTPSSSLRSRSMPKINDANHNNNGCDSPLGSHRSLSSDDHGFGSASLSQLSGSPNIEYSYPRKRLYQSIPNRTFVCIKSFKPTQPGELELKKGDIIELLSVGEKGFWEGRKNSNNSEGWFPSDCVQEFHTSNDSSDRDSVVIPKKTLLDLITHSDVNMPRTIVLQRGKKGFGFVLRGAKAADVKFEPTPEIPALQFLENVDKGSNAEKAGLKPFDFVIEINGVDVTCRTHDECVKLIKKSGDTLALKVLTVNSLNGQQQQRQSNININSTVTSSSSSSASNCLIDGTKSLPHKKKPIPPKRHPNTSLTSIDICTTNDSKSTTTSTKTTLLSKYKSISKSTSNISQGDTQSSLSSSSTTSKIQLLLSKSKPTASSTNKLNHQISSDSTNNNNYMSSVFAQIDELDKTLAEYDRLPTERKTDSLSSNKMKNLKNNSTTASIRSKNQAQNNDDNFKTMMNLQAKTLSYPNIAFEPTQQQQTTSQTTNHSSSFDASQNINDSTLVSENNDNRASSDTLVQEEITLREPEIDYDQEDATPYASTSVQNITSPSVPPPPPPLPPPAFSNNSTILTTFSTCKSSPLTPRQLKQRNSAKKTSISGDIEQTLADDQLIEKLKSLKFNSSFVNSSKDYFARNPTKILTVNLSNVIVISNRSNIEIPNEVYLNKDSFERIICQQYQLNDSKPNTPPQVPIRTSSSLLTLNNLNPNAPIGGSTLNINDTLNDQIKRAAQERLMKLKSVEQPSSPRNPLNRQSIEIKSELEQAIENHRLKRMSMAFENTNRRNQPHDPPPPPPLDVSIDSDSISKIPLPPPPPPTLMLAPTTLDNGLPPPPSPTALSRLTNANNPATPVIKLTTNSPRTPQIVGSNVNNKANLLPTPPQLVSDPRTSSDFGEIIKKKAAEKLSKFQESKPSVNTVTFNPDGSKVYNTPKVVTYTTNSNVQKITFNGIPKTPVRHQIDEPSINIYEKNIVYVNNNNKNESSFMSSASKLLEKVKQSPKEDSNYQVLPSKNTVKTQSFSKSPTSNKESVLY